jgi:hypothetical protein
MRRCGLGKEEKGGYARRTLDEGARFSGKPASTTPFGSLLPPECSYLNLNGHYLDDEEKKNIP